MKLTYETRPIMIFGAIKADELKAVLPEDAYVREVHDAEDYRVV